MWLVHWVFLEISKAVWRELVVQASLFLILDQKALAFLNHWVFPVLWLPAKLMRWELELIDETVLNLWRVDVASVIVRWLLLNGRVSLVQVAFVTNLELIVLHAPSHPEVLQAWLRFELRIIKRGIGVHFFALALLMLRFVFNASGDDDGVRVGDCRVGHRVSMRIFGHHHRNLGKWLMVRICLLLHRLKHLFLDLLLFGLSCFLLLLQRSLGALAWLSAMF